MEYAPEACELVYRNEEPQDPIRRPVWTLRRLVVDGERTDEFVAERPAPGDAPKSSGGETS